jgi:hypothetical protein
MVVEEAARHHLVDVSYYEFGGSGGIEIVSRGQRLGCDACATPLSDRVVQIARSLPPGHHLVIGLSNLHMSGGARGNIKVTRFLGYAATEGDSTSADTSAGQAADGTAVESAVFTNASLPRLKSRSIAFASLPCEAAGRGSATLRGTSTAEMNCANNYLLSASASSATSWSLRGSVTGVTGIRIRLAALATP